MPARIEQRPRSPKRPHAQLVKYRCQSACNQKQSLRPGLFGQFRWRGSQRPPKIIKDRKKVTEQVTLGRDAHLRLLLADTTSVIHKVRLRSSQQVQVFFCFLALRTQPLLFPEADSSSGPGGSTAC